MMKKFILLLLSFVQLSVLAQSSGIKVEVSGNIFNAAEDSVYISMFYGNKYVDFLRTKLDKKGNYTLKGQVPNPNYYVLRKGNQHIYVVLRDSANIRINADGKNLAFHNITGSAETVALIEFVNELSIYNQKKDSAIAKIQKNPELSQQVNQEFQQEYFNFASYRQKFIAYNQKSAALLPVISSLDLDKDYETYKVVATQLFEGFKECPNVQLAYQQFDQKRQQKEAMAFLEPGKIIPSFSQKDANGKDISIESLRGKVVLVDFWASWCGPCRAENPNVVRMYEKYKDAGFTVMSISMDSDKSKWLAAIQKDGLVWENHVSDLKGWGNEVGQQFKVTSIPFTLLIDTEGKIISQNLRGVQLEQTLQSIFGF